MTVPETLLQRSWRRAWSEVGGSGSGEALRRRLADAWREPQRRYHTLQQGLGNGHGASGRSRATRAR